MPLVGRKGHGVFRPWPLEVRQTALRVMHVFRIFRRGAGKGTRGACAPRNCVRRFSQFHDRFRAVVSRNHLKNQNVNLSSSIWVDVSMCSLPTIKLTAADGVFAGVGAVAAAAVVF